MCETPISHTNVFETGVSQTYRKAIFSCKKREAGVEILFHSGLSLEIGKEVFYEKEEENNFIVPCPQSP